MALKSLVPRAVPETGDPRMRRDIKAKAVEKAGSTTRSKIPGHYPCHHGRVVGAAAAFGYEYV